MARKLGFTAAHADRMRQNKAALEYYATASGRDTPVEQSALHAHVKPKISRGPRKPSVTATEADVQRSIIAFLCAHPKVALVIRFNSGAVQSDKYYVEFAHVYSRGFKGEKLRLPDVYALLKNGRTMWIECKRENWTRTFGASDAAVREKEQSNFLEHINACGGIGIFARSIDDVRAVL